jgi:hypothetical protein
MIPTKGPLTCDFVGAACRERSISPTVVTCGNVEVTVQEDISLDAGDAVYEPVRME